MISKKKYEYYQKFNFDKLEPKEQKEFLAYQKANPKKVNELTQAYFKKINTREPEQIFTLTYENLLNGFLNKFHALEGKPFIKDRLTQVEPILYYFCNDKRFFECKNLTNLTKPSFEKGLLIIGNFGNGKTATMKTLQKLFAPTPLHFKGFTANEIVNKWEVIKTHTEREQYFKLTQTGTAYFDDVKTERLANNFGIVNTFKDILENRYSNKAKTFITCNYKEGSKDENLQDGLNEFNTKYGARVFDRIYEMFNIIEFNGKSLR